MNYIGLTSSLSLICGPDTIKYACIQVTSPRQHFGPIIDTMNFWYDPSTLQSLMNEIFKEYLRKFNFFFFDDILIYSQSWEDHLSHVKVALSILRAHKLFVKMEKCQFGRTKVNYLGHVISKHGVAVVPDKISTMIERP